MTLDGTAASPFDVKFLRLSLLLLLAVLLPVRGAVAAAMLCDGVGMTMQSIATAGEHRVDTDMAGMTEMADMDEAASQSDTAMPDQDHDHAHHDAHSSGHGDKCNLCSAACSMTPLLGGSPMAWLPPDATNVAFSDSSAAATSFVSDGPERPPRTI